LRSARSIGGATKGWLQKHHRDYHAARGSTDVCQLVHRKARTFAGRSGRSGRAGVAGGLEALFRSAAAKAGVSESGEAHSSTTGIAVTDTGLLQKECEVESIKRTNEGAGKRLSQFSWILPAVVPTSVAAVPKAPEPSAK
jgi:hypothetical protein